MTAVAFEPLARHDLQPARMTCAEHAGQSTAIRIQDADREGDVCRDFHEHRPVRLDRRVPQYLTHAEAATRDAKGAVAEIVSVLVWQRDDLFDAQKSCGPIRVLSVRGIADRGNAAGRGVDAIDVVHAADAEDARALRQQLIRVVHTGDAIENDRGERLRRAGDDFRIDEAFLRCDDRLLRVVAHVVDINAVQRGRFDRRIDRVVEAVRSAGDDATFFDEPALRPAHEQTIRTIEQGGRRTETTARGRSGNRPYIRRECAHLRRTSQARIRRARAARVVDVIRRIDEHEIAAFVRAGERANECERAPILHRTRLKKLNRRGFVRLRIERAGRVAVRTIEKLAVAAVRPDHVQVHLAALERLFPVRIDDPSIAQH